MNCDWRMSGGKEKEVWSLLYQLTNIQEKLHLFKSLHRNQSTVTRAIAAMTLTRSTRD
jgi:hypothetical protein